MNNQMQMPVWQGWETVKEIGEGSYGKVYEIRRELFGDTEKAALKVISIPRNKGEVDEMYGNGYDRESVYHTLKHRLQNILDEYKLMRKMNGHSNVVNCDDVNCVEHEDEMGWDVYIKMELLTPLMEKLRTTPRVVGDEMVIKLARDMCAALELCRKYGIIHRDIKPQNIFISDTGDYKLGDFGIAKTVEKTMGGTKAGTYNYMAPEVFWNRPYNSASDICSLGVVLYWLLNERRLPFLPLPPTPIHGEMENNARNRRLYGEELPEPAHGSQELKRIVLKACAYDPAQRYQNAGQMLADLENLGGGAIPIVGAWVDNGQQNVYSGERSTVYAGDTAAEGTVIENTVIEDTVVESTVIESTIVEDTVVEPSVARAPVVKPESKKKPKKEKKSKERGFEVPPVPEKPKKSRKWLLVAAAAVIALLLLLKGCPGGEPAETTIPTEPPLRGMGEWSDWVEALPEDVSAATHLIQERPLYRSKVLEVTSSVEETAIEGWTYVETKEEPGEWGEWSDWTTEEIVASELTEVETQTQYRYKSKETMTSANSTVDGWTLYDTKKEIVNYGSWSDWSKDAISETSTRDVDTKTQYRYQDMEYTTSSKSSLSGWTQYDSKATYGEWSGWSAWSDTPVSESDTCEVRTQQVEIPGATTYVYSAYYSSDSPKVGSGFPSPCGICAANTYGGTWSLKSRVETSPRPPSNVTWKCEHVGRISQRYQGSNGAFYYYEKVKVEESTYKTQYSYRTRSKDVTYHFYKWGEWSSWSDTKVSSSDSRKVEKRTMYRSRSCETKYTYSFYRWTDWSDWGVDPVEQNSKTEVESALFYRRRDRQMLNVNYFSRWTDWSNFSTEFAAPSETQQVESKLTLRHATRPTDGSDTELEMGYTDIAEGSIFYDAVKWVNDQGIMKGVSAEIFSPDGACTNRQMLIVLWRAMGYPEPARTDFTFTDVTEADPYRKAIFWAVDAGIAESVSADVFGVDALCTRGQVIEQIYKALGSPEVMLKQEPFEDVDPDDSFYQAVLWAYEHSISSGVSTTMFGVEDTCNRGQIAAMLYRAMAN